MLTHSLNAHILKIQCIQLQHKYACMRAHTHKHTQDLFLFHCLLWHDAELQNVVGSACKWMGEKLIMWLETDVSSELLLTSLIVTNPGLALTLHPGIRGTETERNCLSFSVVPQCFIPNSKLEMLFFYLFFYFCCAQTAFCCVFISLTQFLNPTFWLPPILFALNKSSIL